jgi:hypothetical protein
MSSPLAQAIENLTSDDARVREAAARNVYGEGRKRADLAAQSWWSNAELSSLLHAPSPIVTVGIAVPPATFDAIRVANDSPRLAEVPQDQDAREFELHFPDGIALDVLTSREPGESGAIARYLAKFGAGIQQVEFQCRDVDRATAIMQEKFGIAPVYPATRPGADGTRINFFLVSAPEAGKVLIELYERSPAAQGSPVTPR